MQYLSVRSCVVATCLFLTSPLILALTSHAADSWPQWRGSDQNGVAVGESFPSRWSENTGITWKTELPGSGGSTPVVSDETAYLTAGVDGKNMLLAFDITDGSLKWQTALGTDRGNKHKKGSGSNPSALIDGDLIFAYFRSGDLACVNSDGKIQWQVNLQEKFGEDSLWWDLGSSPTLTKDAVVVAVMQTGPSYLVALDKQTGKQLWKTDRMLDAPQEAAQSYSTPLLVSVNDEEAIAVMGADHLTLHRAADGKATWRARRIQSKGGEILSIDFIPCSRWKPDRLPLSRGRDTHHRQHGRLGQWRRPGFDRLVSRRPRE